MARKQKVVTDKQLVKQLQQGSEAAFEEIISRYQTKVYQLAMRLTRSQEDSEEVIQDVFMTIHKKIALFEGKSAFSSWLYRIVVNTAFMKLRKNKQTPTISAEDLTPSFRQMYYDGDPHLSAQTDQPLIEKQISSILNIAIERLPEQYRSVFVLRDVQGFSNLEVSEVLHLTIPAVKSRLHRSRIMLRKKLRKSYEELYGRVPDESAMSFSALDSLQ